MTASTEAAGAVGTGTADDTLLRVDGLTRVFGRGEHAVRAVDDVSFEVRRGHVSTVVGESGSGKSTLARMVLRLLDPTAGTITVNGRDVTGLRGGALKAYWQDVQAVFQDPFSAFNQFFSVRRLMLRSAGLLHGVSQDEVHQRMTESLEQVGMRAKDVLDK
jgi:peptide/nickel transport system ATP-binding protein